MTSSTTPTARRYDIDWLRILAVLLLIPFHSGRIFNLSEPFYVKNNTESIALSYFLGMVDLWHMPLLFLLAGAATWFGLSARGGGGYIIERFKRLFIPLLFGILIIVPPQAYIAQVFRATFTGSLLQFFPQYFTFGLGENDYYGTVITPAHLWFIMFLFVFALVALPLFLYLKRDQRFIAALASFCQKPGAIFLLAFPIWLLGGLFEFAGKNPLRDITIFILGFIIVADARFANAMDKHRRVAVVIAIVTLAIALIVWSTGAEFEDNSLPDILFYTVRVLNLWSMLVALLAYGKRYLNFTNALQKYANEAAYPFYILHQTVIIAIGYFVVQWNIDLWVKYLAIAISAFVTTLLVYDIFVKRWNVIRFLFGMKPKK